MQLNKNGATSGGANLVPSSSFMGKSLKKVMCSKVMRQRSGSLKVVNEKPDEKQTSKGVTEYDEEKQTSKDRWGGLAYDTSDDQQDITRGKGMVDSLFQAPMDTGTHYAVLSSYDYISKGLRQ